MNLFVSYTVRDGLVEAAKLRQLAKRLEEFSHPYIDLLEHRCGGHQPSVWKALQRADALLLCATPCLFRSPWVVQEWLAAKRRRLPVYVIPPTMLAADQFSLLDRRLITFTE